MRILHLKRNRALRLLVAFCLLLPILYLLFTSRPAKNTALVASSFKVKKPYLTKGLGNFEPEEEEIRNGPGEEGRPHHMRDDQQKEISEAVSQYGMNMACSDEISLDRSIPDTRLPECKRWVYPKNLPKASVIIVFHNEGWSTLLRTFHSVLNRTPPELLEEILLVDDFSDKENLKENLEDYITRFDGRVRLIRNSERQGLIRTRSRGAQEATGEVIVFLDAHCEVNKNWLPPLLAPIHADRVINPIIWLASSQDGFRLRNLIFPYYKPEISRNTVKQALSKGCLTTMTVPVIDGINHDNFQYRPVYQNGQHYRGIFEWGMLYKENELSDEFASADGRKYNSEPYKSPTHAGGLFAIDRKYFLELGGYDPGLLVWGGENFELSFKIWQCGGSILWVPCSRVGHVYRSFMPYNFGTLGSHKKGPLITINYKRVIETWFDEEYKEYFYTREPLARFLNMGDISEQLELKKRLKCKSFKWFMDNVAPDLLSKFPIPPPNLYWGELENRGRSYCLDTEGQDAPAELGVADCIPSDEYDISNLQVLGRLKTLFLFFKLHNSATRKCMDTMGHGPPATMGVSLCHGLGNNQLVRLNTKGQLSIGERCVDGGKQGIKLVFCRLGTVDGPWQYDDKTKTLLHTKYQTCMALHPQTSQLSLMPCNTNNIYQQWVFKQIHPDWR